MDEIQHIRYWLDSAAHDLDTAEALFKSDKYDWCLYVGHLVIEKVLKAFYVRDNDDSPPRIHNLVNLAENTSLSLSEMQKQLLGEVNRFNIEARYPDYKHTFYTLCTKEFTEEYFTKIKEMYSWLLSQVKQ